MCKKTCGICIKCGSKLWLHIETTEENISASTVETEVDDGKLSTSACVSSKWYMVRRHDLLSHIWFQLELDIGERVVRGTMSA